MRSLYEVLGVAMDCSFAEITKAYRMMALKLHPDRNAAGAEEFLQVQEAYDALKDPEKRAAYDAGAAPEDAPASRVSASELDAFAAEYRHSAEQAQDIMEFYERRGAQLEQVFEYVPLLEPEPEDVAFLRRVLLKAVAKCPVETAAFEQRWKQFKSALAPTCRKIRRERTRFAQEFGDASFADLVTAIRQNGKTRTARFAALADNVTAKSAKRGKRRG